ncbi:hypothetical protein PPERSA_06070 [Pseudocohnilembus persalinus]|uniref:Uncharacterized protein n=1 Tax=Pseudocohnilembus persalinus TaxID=266149 RepID=A0A0V0QV03_PSEPJ|nr:hypothetical protein PPERSA_06070 [Pseudocohnilembus persalinus]|eukprot:KRX06188.1 hypothetical protein PPERSA_06070 [Pseudocohnilembus persalinus]
MPWKFGKFNSTEFVPSLRKYQKNKFKIPEDEIGEYPQYFIKKNNHKQNKEFLSSDIWDDLGSKKEQNVKKKVQNVLRKSYSSKFFQTQQSQFSKQSDEIQNRLYTLEPLEVKQHQFKYRQQLKDLRLQQLNEERLMKQQIKQQINRARSEEFKYRQYQEKVLQDSKKIEVMTKFLQKMTQAQKIQENIELTKKAASQQVKELENQKLQQAKQIRAQKKEEDDIQQMNLQLRAVCLEQSVENNVKKELKRKLGQVDHLKKIYKYKEPYIADYLKTGVNFKNEAQESQDNYY